MIVIVIPRQKGKLQLDQTMVISRGFVFMKEADEVIQFIKEQTAQAAQGLKGKDNDYKLRQAIEKRLSKSLFKIIRREPLIVPVIFDVN